ncbi:hypothetical protein M405DRAFT_61577 [Rhizopogon salebrosus TDB-379]|nr:hypothetical protein M405DRAFT_61577 [Rhizopogon salebrosus TDB-379]
MSLRPFRRWFVPTIQPANQPTRNLLASATPKENASNGSFMISARTCYMLHGILVIVHMFLVISYISHWEHRVTLPFTTTNDNFWSVVLSASLQAFYTIYTAALLFLTQRLAISRTLVRRLKLTSIHDISGAWSGLGSALSSVCQQIDIPVSWWATSAVAAYLACISVLHVTSSTLLAFQIFNTSMSTSVPTALGWQSNLLTNTSESVNWGAITASLPVVNQLPGLVFAGLSGATLYDTPKTSSIVGNATVNATTITSHCGLLPNVTYYAGDYYNGQINVSVDTGFGSGLAVTNATLPWPDQIQVLQLDFWIDNSGAILNQFDSSHFGVFLMISTLLDMAASIRDQVSVQMTWEYNPSLDQDRYSDDFVPYDIEVYFVHCSLSATTARAMVDMQNNSLRDTMPISQPSTQWEIFPWPLSESNSWQNELGVALGTPSDSGFEFFEHARDYISKPSIADEYIMSLAGLHLRAQYLQFSNSATPISNATLALETLEGAIAQAAAQLVWIAGQIGSSNEGLDMGNGMADTQQEIIALRLNVNGIPLMFVVSASVILLGLALHTTRAFDPSHDSQPAIPNTGVLQLLWLGHHSSPVHEVLEDVTHPMDANLRRAGMIDVCFAKKISDEEDQLSVRSSTGSLAGQIDRGHDDSVVDIDHLST